MYWRSTTLPENFAWVNGDLILFEDRPEFEEVYLAGGFEGMLLEANATSEQIAANLGKFRKHPNGLGLYLPSCGEQFFRAWGQGAGNAGGYNAPGLPDLSGYVPAVVMSESTVSATGPFSAGPITYTDAVNPGQGQVHRSIIFNASHVSAIYGASPTVMPASIDLPVILYLGNSA